MKQIEIFSQPPPISFLFPGPKNTIVGKKVTLLSSSFLRLVTNKLAYRLGTGKTEDNACETVMFPFPAVVFRFSAFYAWDMEVGFTYLKCSYVTFSYANVAYVKHNTVFAWKDHFHISKWVHPTIIDGFEFYRRF